MFFSRLRSCIRALSPAHSIPHRGSTDTCREKNSCVGWAGVKSVHPRMPTCPQARVRVRGTCSRGARLKPSPRRDKGGQRAGIGQSRDRGQRNKPANTDVTIAVGAIRTGVRAETARDCRARGRRGRGEENPALAVKRPLPSARRSPPTPRAPVATVGQSRGVGASGSGLSAGGYRSLLRSRPQHCHVDQCTGSLNRRCRSQVAAGVFASSAAVAMASKPESEKDDRCRGHLAPRRPGRESRG